MRKMGIEKRGPGSHKLANVSQRTAIAASQF